MLENCNNSACDLACDKMFTFKGRALTYTSINFFNKKPITEINIEIYLGAHFKLKTKFVSSLLRKIQKPIKTYYYYIYIIKLKMHSLMILKYHDRTPFYSKLAKYNT